MSDNFPWTPEQVETLKRMYAEKLSSPEIGRRLGALYGCEPLSRSAILSKLSSLGLRISRRPELKVTVIPVAPNLKPPKAKPIEPDKIIPRMLPKPWPNMARGYDGKPVPFMSLPRGCCAWPVGPAKEEGTASMLVCGAPREGEGPYCPLHDGLSANPYQPKRGAVPSELRW